ncbi:histone-lysine N-methyltransferase SETMAR [Trichonephila clavipes]|nr:histone-lysine N-methyltransferase SETMAR [Trichonephila clavipes]
MSSTGRTYLNDTFPDPMHPLAPEEAQGRADKHTDKQAFTGFYGQRVGGNGIGVAADRVAATFVNAANEITNAIKDRRENGVETQEHYRAMNFYDFKAGLNQEECVRRLHLAFGDESPCHATVLRCFKEFCSGHNPLQDVEHTERPQSTGLIKAIKLEGQKTVTANWYTTKSLPKILQEVNVWGLMLHHDSASSQTAGLTASFLSKKKN